MREAPWLAVLPAVLAVACAPAEEAAVVDMATEVEALAAVAETYHAAAANLDAAAVTAHYAEDAVLHPSASPDKVGIAAVREHFDRVTSTPGIEIEFDLVEAVVSRDATMGYTLAVGETMYDGPEGNPVTQVLRDFHVWKKNASGEWRLVVDMWNSPEPPPEGG